MLKDAAGIAASLTTNERTALLSLPARDRGHMSEELWIAYYAIMSAGLMKSDGDFLMLPTELGEAVKKELADG